MKPSKNIVFAGLKRRWDDRGLGDTITGGIRELESPERTQRPYAVLECLSDRPYRWSNCSRYDRVTFEITVVSTTPEAAGALAATLDAALQFAPLRLADATPIECRPTQNRYGGQKNYHWATLGYEVKLRRPVDYNPG